MSEPRPSRASEATFAAGESVSMFVLRHLLAGKLEVRVRIDGQVHIGYVHNLDWGKDSDHAFALVDVPDLEDVMVRVALHLDGRVQVLQDYNEDE